jgi:glyoxalase family protein
MPKPIIGLHHVTAIASDPQRNLDFYTGVLGLRFIKRTINFDDPGTYHFYFGDASGAPGTILTFFPWPRAARGVPGVGEAGVTSFSIPVASLDFWERHLKEAGLAVQRTGKRFDEDVLGFTDPDGMKLEIVGHEHAGKANPWSDAAIPPEHAIRGFSGVTLSLHSSERTANVLGIMGFRKIAEEQNRSRYAADGGALGNHVDLVVLPQAQHARLGRGSVHHIAFRAPDDASQLEWRAELERASLDVTPVLDRNYFHSIYFREPGGVLFEIATDPPGFAVDESFETLGETLKLPDWLEPHRGAIENALPRIELKKLGTLHAN